MRRRRWFYWFLFVGSLGLVAGVWIHRNTDEPIPRGDEQVGSRKGTHARVRTPASGVVKTSQGHVHVHEQGVDAHGHPVVAPIEIPAEKLERINTLYDSLPRTKARAKAIEILTEGMDALSAARYLKTLHGFHGDLSDDIREYAERAPG